MLQIYRINFSNKRQLDMPSVGRFKLKHKMVAKHTQTELIANLKIFIILLVNFSCCRNEVLNGL